LSGKKKENRKTVSGVEGSQGFIKRKGEALSKVGGKGKEGGARR